MLSILHRYVLRELLKSFSVAFFSLTAIMLLGALFKPLQHGMGLAEVLRFLPYLLPYSLAWVIPASLLTACVMAYGRLAAENELQAVCASGIPLRYMCYPAFLVAVLLTAVAIPINDRVIPYCRSAKDEVIRQAFYEKPFRTDMSGTYKIGDHKIYIESIEGNRLNNLVVIEPPEKPEENPSGPKSKMGPERVRVIRARRAHYAVDEAKYEVRIKLEDAQYTIVTPGRSATGWVSVTADQQDMVIKAEDPEDKLKRRRAEQSTTELQAEAARTEQELKQPLSREDKARLQRRLAHTYTEIHVRAALAFSALVLCLVGVPLGIWMRRESKLASFAIAVLVFLMLYAMLIGGEGMALEQKLPVRVALWTPDILVGGLGVVMLLRTFRR